MYKWNFTRKHALEKLRSVDGDLIRMEGYMKLCQDGVQIDKALKASIFRLFIEVLTLCKIYAKVEKDSNTTAGKIKNVMKAAIRYDPGLQSTLDEIRAATEHELNNSVAALRITDITPTQTINVT